MTLLPAWPNQTIEMTKLQRVFQKMRKTDETMTSQTSSHMHDLLDVICVTASEDVSVLANNRYFWVVSPPNKQETDGLT